jgi:hypothetical protein
MKRDAINIIKLELKKDISEKEKAENIYEGMRALYCFDSPNYDIVIEN